MNALVDALATALVGYGVLIVVCAPLVAVVFVLDGIAHRRRQASMSARQLVAAAAVEARVNERTWAEFLDEQGLLR